MSRRRTVATGVPFDWGVAHRTLPSESESGDRFVVKIFPQGALLAVVDGLGHGSEAAAAAAAAAEVLAEHAGEHVLSLVRRCHDALTRTRGVAMSLASFDVGTKILAWIGIGNVEGVLVRADREAAPSQEALVLRGGVVGYQLPALQVSLVPTMPGDALVFATDGVRSDFTVGLLPGEAPQTLADRLLSVHAKETDDALVLVVQFPGRPP